MKYENEDGGNKSDVRGSVGSFMKASIIVLDGLLCLVAAVESHFTLPPSPLSFSLSFSLLSSSPVAPAALFRDSLYLALPLSLFRLFSFFLSHPCPLALIFALALLRSSFSTETPTGTSVRFAREFGSLAARRHFVLPFVPVVLIHGS